MSEILPFNKISLKINEYTLTMEPENAYKITDSSVQRVCITYHINLKNDDMSINKDTHVHYYLSDGRTNTLRANLLYPFLFFDIKKDIEERHTNTDFKSKYPENIVLGSKLPYYKSKELVIKNENMITNVAKDIPYQGITINKSSNEIPSPYIEEWLEKFSSSSEENTRGILNSNNLDEKNSRKQQTYLYSSHGVNSIFDRVSNITDLLLLITCPEITNFEWDREPQLPNFLKYRPLPTNFENNIFNMGFSNDEDPEFNFDDYLRLKKLQEIKSLQDIFTKSSIGLTVEQNTFKLNEITYEEFNRIIGIKYENVLEKKSPLSDEFKTRINMYNEISNTIAKELYNFASDTGNRIPQIILEPGKRKTYTLEYYLTKGWVITDPYLKKYLKYKIKFLMLKNAIKN